MNKIVKVILFLFLIAISVQILFTIFGDGHEVLYNIKDKEKTFSVKEIYKQNKKGIEDYYDIVINDTYSYKIFNNLNKKSNIIKEIKYFEDSGLKCIYPIFKVKSLKLDVQCKNGEYLIFYQNIKGINSKLDKFVNQLENYNESQFLNDTKNKEENTFVVVYRNNMKKDLYFASPSYKGIYLINNNEMHKNIETLEIFNHDVYEPNIIGSVGKYLLVADYNSEYNFDTFHIIDLVTGNKKTIKGKEKISFNSFVQGNYKDSIYLIDKDKKTQYEINIKEEKITLVGNTRIGTIFYKNNKKEKKHINDVIKENLKFSNKIEDTSNKFDEVIETTHFYYLLKKEKNKMKVYRKNKSGLDLITFLFESDNVSNYSFDKGYMFFMDKDEVKYYSDETSLKTAYKQSEMAFNSSIKYYIYTK
jgi:hypothetical protein